MERKSFRPVLRFRLQTLLVLFTAYAIALGLAFQEWNREHRRKQIAAEISHLGGHVRLIHPRVKQNKATGVVNGWLRVILGDEYFTEASSVSLKSQSPEHVKLVLAYPELTDLTLVGAVVTDDSLHKLSGLTQLHTLKLSDATLSGRGLESLAELAGLGSVEFVNCSLSEENLKSLAQVTEHSNLASITFAKCTLSDAELQAMYGAGSSVTLRLNVTHVTEAGILALREANPTWTVRFRDQFFVARGGSPDNYLPSKTSLPQVKELAFQGALTSAATLAVLKDASSLSKLELDGCRLTDGDLEHLRALQNLESLAIRNMAITDEGLSALKGLTKLQFLGLNGTKVEGIGVGALPSSVKNLNLANSEITDQGVAVIAKLTSLESLSLGSALVTDKAVDELAKMTQLRRLFLWESAISAPGISRLKQALPECEIITQ